MASRHFIPTAALLLWACFLPPPLAEAAQPGRISIPDLPELADRARAFRQALAELTVDPSTPGPGERLRLSSRWSAWEQFERASLDEPPGIPHLRDLAFEESWLLAGREDEHERAARHWLGRRLKGSDRRGPAGPSTVRVKLAWDHGPIGGLGHGPVSVRFGEEHWRLQWSRRWSRSTSPWLSRVRVGEDADEFRAEFLIGRTLLDAFGR